MLADVRQVGPAVAEDCDRRRRSDVFTREGKAFIRWYALLQLVLNG